MQDGGVLGADVVKIIPLRPDFKAFGVLPGVNLVVEKGKLDVNRGIQVVVKVAQVFKDGCLGIGLCKLIADVRKLDTLGERAGRQAANPVLIHGLIGNTLLGGVGLAVALILADDGLNFFLFCAGQLYRRSFLRFVSLPF